MLATTWTALGAAAILETHDRDSRTLKASFHYAGVTAAGRAQVLGSAALPMLLVDGYNVIWASKRLARLARLRSLDHARERLVNEVPRQCVTRDRV